MSTVIMEERLSLLMGRMGDLEKMGKVKNYNWATSNLLNTGEKLFQTPK